MKVLFLILLICLSGCSLIKPKLTPEQVKTQTNDVINTLKNEPEWLFPADACPAEIMPAFEKEIKYLNEGCENNPSSCLESCKKDDGNACYSLALVVQKQSEKAEKESEALFLRSCKLGIVSGCTNRAAGKLELEASNSIAVKCSADTFEKTCEKNDSWGCAMYGMVLIEGSGREQNLDDALKALSKACKSASDGEACRNAKKLEEEIKQIKSKQQKK